MKTLQAGSHGLDGPCVVGRTEDLVSQYEGALRELENRDRALLCVSATRARTTFLFTSCGRPHRFFQSAFPSLEDSSGKAR